MRIILFTFLACLAFSACRPASTVEPHSANAKVYPFRGKVISVDAAKKSATIQHSAIEGYMDAMTMSFPIHADEVWNDLKPGADLRADLVVDSAAKDPFYLENVVVTAAADPNNPLPVNDKFAQIGQEVPDFSLTNQDGKRISIKNFRGHPLAITFIYARCPLPDYCIRMSTNFSDIANKVMADPAQKDKIRLLSISFDRANDTPKKLRDYGLGYLGKDAKPDFTVWQLAVGKDAEVKKIADFFGLQYETDATDKTKINHSLVTAVIGPDGKVTKIFKGNDWTPAELLTELNAAAGQ